MTLLQRVSAGDPAAVQECIDRYSGLVWSLARRLCPTAAEAEDAVQEVFIALWKNAGRFDPQLGAEPTFVAMIARRRLIDRGRRRKRRPQESALIDDHATAEARDVRQDRVGSRAEVGEDAARAQAALERLSPDQQRVLRLAIHHGLSHEKIAQATDLPLGTVKTHIRRGLIRVREMLAAQSEDEPERPGRAREVSP